MQQGWALWVILNCMPSQGIAEVIGMKSIPWYDLKVGDYIKVKFYKPSLISSGQIQPVLIGKVHKIYGDNITIMEPNGRKFFIYSSNLGVAYSVDKLVPYKAFRAKESEYLADTI